MTSKDGGNAFHGYRLRANRAVAEQKNYTDALKNAPGATSNSVCGLKYGRRVEAVGSSGAKSVVPFIKSKLWFFVVHRYNGGNFPGRVQPFT
jgi:hypothetical protein